MYKAVLTIKASSIHSYLSSDAQQTFKVDLDVVQLLDKAPDVHALH